MFDRLKRLLGTADSQPQRAKLQPALPMRAMAQPIRQYEDGSNSAGRRAMDSPDDFTADNMPPRPLMAPLPSIPRQQRTFNTQPFRRYEDEIQEDQFRSLLGY
jgi:hypothetical protein